MYEYLLREQKYEKELHGNRMEDNFMDHRMRKLEFFV